MKTKLSFIILLHFILTAANDFYDEEKNEDRQSDCSIENRKYNQDAIYVYCDNVTLEVGKPLLLPYMASYYTDRYRYILFMHSTIPLIPVGAFVRFSNLDSLTDLYLNDSMVESIDPGAFIGLTSLKFLHLERNNVTEIPNGGFNSLLHLEMLNISNNKIQNIEQKAFVELSWIRDLDIHNNQLENLPFNIFTNLKKLQNIDLSHNYLGELPNCKLQNLKSLNASHNKIKTLNFSSFSYAITTLLLGNNQIGSIVNWHSNLTIIDLDLSNNLILSIDRVHYGLKRLNVGGNNITVISSSTFNTSETLVTLDLSHNFLSNLSDDTFLKLSSLESLYLQNNKLDGIPIGCFGNLQLLVTLNLSSNNIFELDYGIFSGLTSLQNLDISNNKLMYLNVHSFSSLKKLTYLNIGHNLISSLDADDLLEYLRELRTITLSENPWNCKALSIMVKNFEKHNVFVTQGSRGNSKNIRYIACRDYKNISTANSPNISDSPNYSSVSNDLNALHKFLNNDFVNSEFYKFFKVINTVNINKNVTESYFDSLFLKYFEDGFKNTTFYKYFNQNVFNVKFLREIDQAFSKLSLKLSTVLNDGFKNSSLFTFFNSKRLPNNFEIALKNSNLQKYFNGDVQNSSFLQNFDRVLEHSVEANLQKLRNYFNVDFGNSSFYKFFTAKAAGNTIIPAGNLSANNFTDKAHFERYSDETRHLQTDHDQILGNIKDDFHSFKVANITFMTIIIIVLLSIVFMLSFKHVKVNFVRDKSLRKSFLKNSNATSEVELV